MYVSADTLRSILETVIFRITGPIVFSDDVPCFTVWGMHPALNGVWRNIVGRLYHQINIGQDPANVAYWIAQRMN